MLITSTKYLDSNTKIYFFNWIYIIKDLGLAKLSHKIGHYMCLQYTRDVLGILHLIYSLLLMFFELSIILILKMRILKTGKFNNLILLLLLIHVGKLNYENIK